MEGDCQHRRMPKTHGSLGSAGQEAKKAGLQPTDNPSKKLFIEERHPESIESSPDRSVATEQNAIAHELHWL